MELRKRNVKSAAEGSAVPESPSKLTRALRRLDVYPKIEEEFAVHTSTGAAVTLTTVALVCLLFIGELNAYLTVQTTEHVSVDTQISETMKVNFNISFPAVRCGVAMVDVMDMAGEQQVNVDNNMFKQRISKEGTPIGDWYLDRHKVEIHSHMRELFPGVPIFVQSPGGGDGHEGHSHESQSQDEHHESTEKDPSQPGEGCRLMGSLLVNKVAGNFHIALGASHKSGGRHVHHFMLQEAAAFNNSHTIHSLSFGESVAGLANPLDGVTRVVDKASAHFQYFLKVVGTTHIDLSGRRVVTNQYSVTEQFKPVDLVKGQGANKIPGVFFLYDISPFHVTITDQKASFSEFLISVCAIIGGAVTIASLIDKALYHGDKFVKQQISTASSQSASGTISVGGHTLAVGSGLPIIPASATPPISRPAATKAAKAPAFPPSVSPLAPQRSSGTTSGDSSTPPISSSNSATTSSKTIPHSDKST